MSKPVDTLEDLFKWGSRPVADTSRQAYEAVQPKINDYHAKIIAFIEERDRWGATMDETCAATGMLVQTASARFRELVQWFKIEDSGARRKTRSGKAARVYILKPSVIPGSAPL